MTAFWGLHSSEDLCYPKGTSGQQGLTLRIISGFSWPFKALWNVPSQSLFLITESSYIRKKKSVASSLRHFRNPEVSCIVKSPREHPLNVLSWQINIAKAHCDYLKGTRSSLRAQPLLGNRFGVLTRLVSVALPYQVPYFNIQLFTFTPAQEEKAMLKLYTRTRGSLLNVRAQSWSCTSLLLPSFLVTQAESTRAVTHSL